MNNKKKYAGLTKTQFDWLFERIHPCENKGRMFRKAVEQIGLERAWFGLLELCSGNAPSNGNDAFYFDVTVIGDRLFRVAKMDPPGRCDDLHHHYGLDVMMNAAQRAVWRHGIK